MLLFVLALLLAPHYALAEDLAVEASDLSISQGVDGGYHLYIRRTGDIASVLLTESTEDPRRQAASYAYRSPTPSSVTANEHRILNGEFIDDGNLFFLVDSTTENVEGFGEAFHLWIPYIVEFGYPWTRNGSVQILDGAYLNIRTFGLPNADYSGAFRDNPFVLRVVQSPLPGPPEETTMPATVESYEEIAEENEGEAVTSTGEEDIVERLRDLIEQADGRSLDLVVALDATQSMENDIEALRRTLVPMLREMTSRFATMRVGMVLYKDYYEEFLVRSIPFTGGLDLVQRTLDALHPWGGRDIPEAVYEALYEAVNGFEWISADRLVVLVGDAPPHPRPRGRITREMVDQRADELGVSIHAIILPQ